MPEPTEDMRELLRAIQTEIGAGKGFGIGNILAGDLIAANSPHRTLNSVVVGRLEMRLGMPPACEVQL